MAEDSDLEKTESASARRLEQAREEGQVPHSRELATFISLMVGVVALTALEFLVAFLQAFVFAVLASIYLNDVVNLGHGH